MKSKIKEVVRIRFHSGSGNHYHDLVMENGDKINIGKKKEQEVGWELEYIIEGEGQEFNKAKSVYNPPANKGGDNLKGIKVGHAITNGVNLFIANGTYESADMKESIKAYSKMVYEISEELNKEI